MGAGTEPGGSTGALPTDDVSLLPPVTPNDLTPPRPIPVPNKNVKGTRPVPNLSGGSDDPIAALKNRFETIQQQLDEANRRLKEEQEAKERLSKELAAAVEARQKAENERKRAADVA